MRKTLMTAAAVLALAAIGTTTVAQQSVGSRAAPAGRVRWKLVPMLVESKAFEDGGIVPLKYSFYGANTLPDFKLSNLPETTQTDCVMDRVFEMPLETKSHGMPRLVSAPRAAAHRRAHRMRRRIHSCHLSVARFGGRGNFL